MRKDGFLTNLSDWLKHNPRQEGQSIQDRALEVYRAGIEAYDDLDAQERALREDMAHIAEAARFYALLSLKTREAFIVNVADLDAFCAKFKLNKTEVLKVAMGEVLEHKCFIRWNNINAMGQPYKPPRPKEDEIALKRLKQEAQAEQRRIDQLNQELYTLPPAQRTVHFTPINS